MVKEVSNIDTSFGFHSLSVVIFLKLVWMLWSNPGGWIMARGKGRISIPYLSSVCHKTQIQASLLIIFVLEALITLFLGW